MAMTNQQMPHGPALPYTIDEYLYGTYGRKDGVTLRDWCEDHGEPYHAADEEEEEDDEE